MLIRFVKMTFDPDYVPHFLKAMEGRQATIRAFDGCRYLQILQDLHHPNIIFSHSYWESEEALDAYRHSDFFAAVWRETKPNFIAKAEAWSVHSLAELP